MFFLKDEISILHNMPAQQFDEVISFRRSTTQIDRVRKIFLTLVIEDMLAHKTKSHSLLQRIDRYTVKYLSITCVRVNHPFRNHGR
jgi:hypothetical protein